MPVSPSSPLSSRISPVLPDLTAPVHHGAGPYLGPLPNYDGHYDHVRRLETADVQLALDDRAVADIDHVEVADEGMDSGGPRDLGCGASISRQQKRPCLMLMLLSAGMGGVFGFRKLHVRIDRPSSCPILSSPLLSPWRPGRGRIG